MARTKTTPELVHGSEGSAEWYTPQKVIDLVHELFPGGFHDVASCFEAQQRVKATIFCDKERDARKEGTWGPLPVFCNPPGGKTRLTQTFWKELGARFLEGQFEEAIWLSFSLDTLQTCQDGPVNILDVPTFVPHRRLKYWDPKQQKEVGGVRPSAITYFGDRLAEFELACLKMGQGRLISV